MLKKREYAIAIDLGATNLRVGIGKNEILEKLVEPTPQKPKLIISRIGEMVEQLMKKHKAKIRAIGISSIGPINLKEGCIVNPANLQVRKLKLVEPLREKFKVDVSLLNDCNAAVLAEHNFGFGKGMSNIIYVTLSTGIGGGVIVGGNLLLGKDGNAAEIGHTTIDFEGRLKCGCGKRGHWEAYCSGANIPKFIRLLSKQVDMKNSRLFKISNGLRNLDSKMLFNCAKAGDKVAKKIVDEIGRLNAIGIANLINAFDPELITIGGSIALKNPKLILQPIKKYVKKYAVNRIPKIKITSLGEDVCLLGALASIKESVC